MDKKGIIIACITVIVFTGLIVVFSSEMSVPKQQTSSSAQAATSTVVLIVSRMDNEEIHTDQGHLMNLSDQQLSSLPELSTYLSGADEQYSKSQTPCDGCGPGMPVGISQERNYRVVVSPEEGKALLQTLNFTSIPVLGTAQVLHGAYINVHNHTYGLSIQGI